MPKHVHVTARMGRSSGLHEGHTSRIAVIMNKRTNGLNERFKVDMDNAKLDEVKSGKAENGET